MLICRDYNGTSQLRTPSDGRHPRITMRDAAQLVDDLHDLIKSEALDGLGAMKLDRNDPTALTIWWKEGAFPAPVLELCERSGLPVQLLFTPFSAEEVLAAIREVVPDLDRTLGPNVFSAIGPSSSCDHVRVEVRKSPEALPLAQAFFAEHQLRTPDGRVIPVVIKVSEEFGPVQAL